MKEREHLIDWLRDAHAMEMKGEQLMTRQVERLESYPQIKMQLQQHIEVTRNQAKRLETCINRMDSGTSTMKDMAGKLMANMGALFNAGTEDEVVKDMLGNVAVEHFEIACYRSLIAAAEELGDVQTAQICREILREEEQMAAWVEEQIPTLTRDYLQREAMDARSKN